MAPVDTMVLWFLLISIIGWLILVIIYGIICLVFRYYNDANMLIQ